MLLSFTPLGPFQVFLLDGFFYSFLRTLIHEGIITKETADSPQEGRPAFAEPDDISARRPVEGESGRPAQSPLYSGLNVWPAH